MNKYQKSAAERFDKIVNKDFFINPMSTVDNEIMIEIGQILKKAGVDEVFQILQSYKEVKDSDVLEQLMNWNLDNPKFRNKKNVEDVKGAIQDILNPVPVKFPPFLQIGDLALKIYDLHGFRLCERFDHEGNEKYGIIINPTPDHAKQIPLYANYNVEWYSEENRTKVLDKLKTVCLENNTEFVDLTEDE